MKHNPEFIANLCVGTIKKRTWMDPSTRSMSILAWLSSQSVSEDIKTLAYRVFQAVNSAGSSVPFVERDGSGVLFTWISDTFNKRILYVSVQPGRSVRFQVGPNHVIGGDFTWKYIVDNDTIESRLRFAGLYMEAKVETTTAA